jgi:hypothetical protein
MLAVVNLEKRDIKTKLIDYDMRGKGATAGDVVELHKRSPKRSITSPPFRKRWMTILGIRYTNGRRHFFII